MNKLGVCVVVVCIATLTACRTSKEGFVAKGNKLFAAGKYADAELQYRSAIQKDVQYGEAYYRLGLVEERLQRPGEAQRALLRAVQLLPQSVDAKEKLGSLMLEYYLLDPHHSQAFYTVVKQVSDELLAKNPNSFEGLREKGYLAVSDGKPEEGIALFRKAVQANPSDGTLVQALADTLHRNGHAPEGERLALDFISRQKSFGPMYDLLTGWYAAQNRPADAENMMKLKAANNPKQSAFILELAVHYGRIHKQAEMRAALQRLLDDPKTFPQAQLLVGDFYMAMRAYPEAIHYYEDGARSAKEDDKLEYLKRASNALVADGKREEASRLIAQIVKDNPNNEEAKRIQASLLLLSGQPENVAAAEREFQDLSKEGANDAAIWLGLGRADVLKGDLDAARVQYLEALKKQRDLLPARYALAEIGLLQNQPTQTLQQTEEILKVRPTDTRARMLHAQALLRSNNLSSARAELNNLSKSLPNAVQPQLELALLSLSERKYRDADQIFEKLRSTGDVRAYAGQAMSYSAQGQFNKAIDVLNEGLTKSPGSVLLMSELAGVAANAQRYDLAVAEFQKLLAAEPKSVTERLRLGELYSLLGKDGESIAVYRDAYNLAPKDLKSGLALGKELSATGHSDEARTVLSKVLADHPDDPAAQNEFAFFISQNGGDLDEALRLSQLALKRAPEQPSFSDTMGCIYLKKGLRDSALKVFGNLVQKYPNYPTFRYHLGMVLLEKGEKSSAKKELNTALGSHPSRQDEARIKELLSKIS